MATMNSIGTLYPVEVASGGTGESTMPQHSIAIGGATNLDYLPVGSSNYILTGVTGSDPVWSNSIDVGSITISGLGRGVVQSSAAGLLSSSEGIDGQLLVSSGTGPVAWANITSTSGYLDVADGPNTIDLDLDSYIKSTIVNPWFGSTVESASVSASSDGTTITFSAEKSGGGDLVVIFGDGYYNWDCTPPDTVTLTAGTDTNPVMNYVYLDNLTKTLTASTTGWPHIGAAPLAEVLCQSAASIQADGVMKFHAWTDHLSSTSTTGGHIAHVNLWIRQQYATWLSDVVPTLTITTQGASPDNVIFTNTSGAVLQLHPHVFPAFTGTPDVYTVNDPTTSYNKVTDLNSLLTDSTGSTMSGRYFSLVIWGVVSQDQSDCKLMVNLPSCSYGTEAQLQADVERCVNYGMPSAFKGTGFLIAKLNLRHQTSGSGTWTEIETIDLRGQFPSTSAGGASNVVTEFSDSTFRIFDNLDSTKEMAFQVDQITTATTRTITMADRDIDLDEVADIYSTDSGDAVPVNGVAIIAGGANIATSGAGSTTTINFDGILPIANGGNNTNTMTNTYGVNYYDGTKIETTAVGTATHVLTSNGVGVAPTFQAAGGGTVDSVTGGTNINITGTAADPIVNLDNTITLTGKINLPTTTATDGQITINSIPVLHTYGTDNIFIGDSGNFTLTGTDNIMIGKNAGDILSAGSYNIGIGTEALSGVYNVSAADRNIAIGYKSLGALVGYGDDAIAIGHEVMGTLSNNGNTSKIVVIGNYALSKASQNAGSEVIIGYNAAHNLNGNHSSNVVIGAYAFDAAAGSGYPSSDTPKYNTIVGAHAGSTMNGNIIKYNTLIGYTSGNSFTSTESSNIIIGNTGTAADANTIRIGTDGSGDNQQDKAHIAGIYNITPGGSTQELVVIDSNGQLGSKEDGVSEINAQTGTTYTPVITDRGKVVTCSNASAITLTVPPNSSVAFPVGTMIRLIMEGAGQLSIAAGSGVTIRSEGSKLKVDGQYASALLFKTATDIWNLSGQIKA